MENSIIKKGQEIELTIDSLAFGGQGIGRFNDFVVFVRGGLPGQTINARITKKKKSHAEARLLSVVKESAHYVKPKCKHVGACGGCAMQQLDYTIQVKEKEHQVFDILERLGGLRDFEKLPIVPADPIFHYRNKMEFSFARQRWLSPDEIESDEHVDNTGHFVGMHAKGFYDKIIDLEECYLVNPIATEILAEIRKVAVESGLPIYSTSDHLGFWRFIVIRSCVNTDDLMVNVVTHDFNKEIAEKLAQTLTTKFPQITSLLNGVTQSKASVAYTEKDYLLHGNPVIYEKLGAYTFEISSNSFFQTNTSQAKRLYDVTKEFAELSGTENVYDLYCGAGSISLYVSDLAQKVTGFESVEPAVTNAFRNAEMNNVTNCDFVCGDLMTEINETQDIISKYGKPDVLIIDPPRGGMHPKTLKAVNRLHAKKIIHVSCNPTTLARDLAELCKYNYKLVKVQPVDMFPHTGHVEVVAQLVKTKNN